MISFNHIPVMLNEVISGLNIQKNRTYVDGTLGGGGHSGEIAKKCKHLIAIDRDIDAINAGRERLKNFNNITFVKNNFFEIKNILKELDINEVDGILLDLGVSSYQLDNTARGFSYSQSANLDMRMDKEQSLTAEYILNNYTEAELFKIISNYGEEKFAKQIARNIVKARATKPLKSSDELKELIEKSIPAKFRFKWGIPYKRTFQALRIEVNAELDGLKDALLNCFSCLKKGGRLLVITFHSLEDKIAKYAFKELTEGCQCKEYSPICVCGKTPQGKLISKKPITAGEDELNNNKRSQSAKLRIIEKL